jgi:photosystem II stability/assembly factor-like uncharacterized protein
VLPTVSGLGPLAKLVGAVPLPTRTSPGLRQVGHWSPVPLISKESRDHLARRGLPQLGGEGGQWVRDVAFGPDGKTAIWGTDVGGLYRSLDGGITWEPCNVGYVPRGTNCVAFDPRDASRIIAIGANTAAFERHGVYLSTDRGASWRNVLPAHYAGVYDERTGVAFDPNSDRVYWSRTADDRASYGQGVDYPALYVSDDRGETWRELPDSARLGGAFLAHHPGEPVLHAASPQGVFEVREGGATVEKVSDKRLTGLDTSPAAPSRLYATEKQRVILSDDGGRTWREASGIASIVQEDTTFRRIRVSPADGNVFGLYHQRPDYNWSRLVTHDGGESFVVSTFDDELNFLPRNVRQPQFAWHPTDANIVLATGGDWPARSEDGGRSFRWSAGGVNNIYCATSFQFCPDDPDVLFLSSQDYNGGLTHDGGHTWQYVNVSGFTWGGFTYGAAAANRRELWCGMSTGHWGDPRVLMTSHDAGQTWARRDDLSWDREPDTFGLDACLVDPDDPAVRFAGPYRSDDAGRSWHRMDRCVGVWSAANGMLFGVERFPKESYALVSRDHGETWRRIARPTAGDIKDFAYDPTRDRLYMTADTKLWRLDDVMPALDAGDLVEPIRVSLPDVPDGLWTNELHGVAVDPRRPDIVFVCRHSNVFSHPASVLRSTDAGETWTTLTRQEPLPIDVRRPTQLDGARDAIRVRVHPTTGEAWFTTGCYGIWKWSEA